MCSELPSLKLKPQRFGRFLLLDRIASGGMAEVWRAKVIGTAGFQRIIAIKKILAHVAEDREFITMFKDEARITVVLQHANIGQVFELGKVDDSYYMALEYVPGKDTKTLWHHQRLLTRPLAIPIACTIAKHVAEGLDYAHRKTDNSGTPLRIVHRDVSPQNILISWEGEVKLIDFGIAKAANKVSKTQAGILKGKFGYMAPEQVRGLPVDHRADIFGLGVCLYEFLTGERTFQADDDFSLLEMVSNVEITPPCIVNPDIPGTLERILFKALAKEPKDRYQHASELAEALEIFMLEQRDRPTQRQLGAYLIEQFAEEHQEELQRMQIYHELVVPEGEVAQQLDYPEDAPTLALELPAELAGAHPAVAAALRGANDRARQDVRPPMVQRDSAAPQSQLQHPQTTPADMPTSVQRNPRMELTPPPTREVTPLAPFAEENPADRRLPPWVRLLLAAMTLLISFFLMITLYVLWSSAGAPVSEEAPPRVSDRPVEPVKPAAGTLRVASEPPGARVRIDGKDTGLVTPVDVPDLEPDIEHLLRLDLEGYTAGTATFSVAPAGTRDLGFDLEPLHFLVHVESTPAGAMVYPDDEHRPIGKTPLSFDPQKIVPAPTELVLKHRRCRSRRVDLKLAAEAPQHRLQIRLNCR